jgi:hypothetical protein
MGWSLHLITANLAGPRQWTDLPQEPVSDRKHTLTLSSFGCGKAAGRACLLVAGQNYNAVARNTQKLSAGLACAGLLHQPSRCFCAIRAAQEDEADGLFADLRLEAW